jgi:hypothetical protein
MHVYTEKVAELYNQTPAAVLKAFITLVKNYICIGLFILYIFEENVD